MERSIRRAAILCIIECRSADPRLSALTAARRLGITARYVHLVLKDTGHSFAQHVRQRRLDNAAAMLRDPRWRQRRIADVAVEAGFSHLSYFSRAFRRAFGATPSTFRRQAPGNDA